ncbi:hypothetical protein FQN49_002897 [Arthroderma sp. PD_2]|nr:hypothetical protein FQN49_002897 [Arthroderma sp. PD_2]
MEEPTGFSDQLLGIGVSSAVVALDDQTALKHPLIPSHNHAVATERRIFERLGDHPCIVRYIRPEGDGLILERLRYPLREHLKDLKEDDNQLPRIDYIFRWAIQVLKGFQHLHSNSVLQFDVGCHNVLLDFDNNAKLSDFAGSRIDNEKVDVAPETRSTHPCLLRAQGGMNLEPTVGTEIFAIGSMLYEISTTIKPYHDNESHEVEDLFRKRLFPDTSALLLGDVIRKCWTDRYHNVNQIIADIQQISPER